uniref:Uncharacterized protein n=1 Tax=Anguilla anguilla TaxID=7936 RepID=A0A0E9S7U6_ANGAN
MQCNMGKLFYDVESYSWNIVTVYSTIHSVTNKLEYGCLWFPS